MSTTPARTAPAPGAAAHDGGRDPLGWPLAALLREWSARVAATCAELPHGPRGYEVLAAVTRDTPPTQAALASRLGIDRTVMTYLLDELVGAGLVERRQDPADRRARRIVPTGLGREVLAGLDARVARAEDELLSGLDERERATLRHLLERAASDAAPHDDRCAVVARTVPAE
ncbi:MarR family winged helix-turn-helix transcriptional regulator [Isoptericola sp. BMS4]|uniref:MarR family winged helix-turn-helix transcriptional regulator n=1 Tax=Isoptericola sp. BMS4 TaxID=2527875 RepID=UPI001F0F9818|nr:MarR family transcriptional regulator [Isoptericola sp. BMS4]